MKISLEKYVDLTKTVSCRTPSLGHLVSQGQVRATSKLSNQPDSDLQYTPFQKGDMTGASFLLNQGKLLLLYSTRLVPQHFRDFVVTNILTKYGSD